MRSHREVDPLAEAARSSRSEERGAALMVAVLLLSIMGLIGLASMDTVMRDRQVAGFQSRTRASLYPADAGVSWAQGIIFAQVQPLLPEGVGALYAFDPAFPTDGAPYLLGDGTANNSRFLQDPDPAVTQAITYVGKGRDCEDWVMSDEYGNSQWREALFDIRVEGRSPGLGNAARRIEAVGTFCYPFN